METTPTTPIDNASTSPAKRSALYITLISIVAVLALVVLVGSVWTVLNPADKPTPLKETSAEPQLTITGSGFTPGSIKIKAGQSLTWTNRDTTAHRIVADSGQNGISGLDSEDALGLNETYTYTFSTPGTYTYHDADNPVQFKGVIIVEKAE